MKKIGASVAGTAGSTVALILLSRLVGFARTWTQSRAPGDTTSGKAYSTANTVPNVLLEITAEEAFARAIIPLVSGFLAKGMEDELERTASASATWILAVDLPITEAVALAAEPTTRALLGVRKLPEELALAIALLRTFALQVPLYGLSVVPTGILRAYRRFLLPALVPMLSSVAVITIFTVFTQTANDKQDSPGALTEAVVVWLGWRTVMDVVTLALPQIVSATRIVKLRPTLCLPDGVAGRTRGFIGADLGGLLVQQIQIATIMVVVNGFRDTGAYSAYTSANAVYMVSYAVLAVPITVAVLPCLSKAAALPGRPGLTSLTVRPTRLVFDVGTVTVALLTVLASPADFVLEILRSTRGMNVATFVMTSGLAGYVFIYHGSHVLYAVEASRAIALVNPLAWLSVCVTLGASIATGVDRRRQTLTAVGASVSVNMMIGAIGQITVIRRVVRKWAVVDMARPAFIVGAAPAIGATLGHMVARLALGVLGTDGIGAFASAAAGGAVVLSAGGNAAFPLGRDTLRPAGGVKKSGVGGSGAEGSNVGESVSDRIDAQ